MESKNLNLKIAITFHSKIQIPTKKQHKTKDFREIKKKLNNILILTDSRLKALHMGEFSQFFQKGKAYLKRFPGAKTKQLNHHVTTVLAQHQYDSAIIHLGINDLLDGLSIEQISKYVIEITQRCRNRIIGKLFVLVLFTALK